MAVIQTDDFKNAAVDIGSAVSDLFGAQGATASAKSYDEAAAIADRNAQITQQMTIIKETQQSRAINKTLGAQTAGVAGAGFAKSGTALDLMRDSASQGALTKALTADQGAITENSYAEQAGMFRSMSAAANTSATGQKVGGIIQAAGGAINLAKGAKTLFNTGVDPSLVGGEGANALTGTATAQEAADFFGGGGAGAVGDGIFTGATEDLAGDAIGGAIGDAVIEGAGESIVEDAIITAAVWVVCTELHRQGRMPSRTYFNAASSFIAYPERGKRGYYVWAIPSTKHLRAHPDSWYSNLLCKVFNMRAEYIVARKRGRKTSWAGALVTHGLYAACWSISWFVPQSLTKWEGLYGAHR